MGRYEGLTGAKLTQTATSQSDQDHSSLAIEGNSLSIDQVTALLDGTRVVGPAKEILEVQNTIEAYEKILNFDPYKFMSLLNAHAILMRGLIPEAGKWRSGSVGIAKGSQISHVAPKAQFVQGMIKDLLAFVKKSKTTPLITSSVFHHEFEFIHPFCDGNGAWGGSGSISYCRFHPIF